MDEAHKSCFRVGVAQMYVRPTVGENRDRILQMMDEARDAACDVAVFPEGILCDPGGTASPSAFDKAVEAIRAHARTCNLNVVVGVRAGVVYEDHNRALVVDRKGKDLLYYQKNTEVPQRIWIDGVPCGISICSDRWYLEHADLPCLTQGARVMIDISGGHGGDDGRPDLRWVRYRCWAIRNSAFVVVCNPPHHDEPDYMGHAVWGGHSAILDPGGTFLARAHFEKDVVLTADLRLELATRENAEHRRNHPMFRSWWDMGRKVLEGEEVEGAPVAPLQSREREIKIAAAQLVRSAGLDEGVIRIAGALRAASAKGADVVVFPERAVLGTDEENADVDLLSRALDAVREHVRKHRVYAVLGMPILAQERLHNSAVVLDREGRMLTRYDQISARPGGPFVPGHSTRTMWFEIEGVHATVTIGSDLYWPELTELAAYRGMQLHFHLDNWCGASDDANLVRKHSAINYLMPAVCGAWVNAADPGGTGGSLLLRRVGGHNKPDPGGVEAYLPYHTSVVHTGSTDTQILYFVAKTGAKNLWQAWRNRTRAERKDGWWHWISQGIRAVHSG